MAPGEDWAMAVKSIISCSSIQPRSATNFFRSSGMMTKPPPKVKALIMKVEENNVQYKFLSFSFFFFSFFSWYPPVFPHL